MPEEPHSKVDYSDKVDARREERRVAGMGREERTVHGLMQRVAKLEDFIRNIRGGNGIRFENGMITYNPSPVGQPTYADVDLCDGSLLRVPGGEIIPPQTA